VAKVQLSYNVGLIEVDRGLLKEKTVLEEGMGPGGSFGSYAHDILDLPPGDYPIGRERDNLIRSISGGSEKEYVSREHAKIRVEGDDVFVKALDPRNNLGVRYGDKSLRELGKREEVKLTGDNSVVLLYEKPSALNIKVL